VLAYCAHSKNPSDILRDASMPQVLVARPWSSFGSQGPINPSFVVVQNMQVHCSEDGLSRSYGITGVTLGFVGEASIEGDSLAIVCKVWYSPSHSKI
jgi:hypothetical protein